MQLSNISRPTFQQSHFYYTNDHEWLDFQGAVAYIGVCKFKLTGFYQIHQTAFKQTVGLYKKGDIIGSLSYNDFTIDVHMPVDGRIKMINPALLFGDKNILIEQPESNGWVAMIIPSSPNDPHGLFSSENYRMKQYNRQFG